MKITLSFSYLMTGRTLQEGSWLQEWFGRALSPRPSRRRPKKWRLWGWLVSNSVSSGTRPSDWGGTLLPNSYSYLQHTWLVRKFCSKLFTSLSVYKNYDHIKASLFFLNSLLIFRWGCIYNHLTPKIMRIKIHKTLISPLVLYVFEMCDKKVLRSILTCESWNNRRMQEIL